MKILFVDDDILFLKILQKHFSHKETCFVQNAQQARPKLLRPDAFDIVVTDIQMPGESGLQLAHFIYERHPRMKIIVLSSFHLASVPHYITFLSKPISIKDLKEKMRTLCAVEKT